MGHLQHQRPATAGSLSAPPLTAVLLFGHACVCLQVVMWLNQNFLLPEGVDSTEVTFGSLRGRGLLSISMASSGQVNLCCVCDDP